MMTKMLSVRLSHKIFLSQLFPAVYCHCLVLKKRNCGLCLFVANKFKLSSPYIFATQWLRHWVAKIYELEKLNSLNRNGKKFQSFLMTEICFEWVDHYHVENYAVAILETSVFLFVCPIMTHEPQMLMHGNLLNHGSVLYLV